MAAVALPSQRGPLLFISDLHLSATRPAVIDLFLHFLQTQARQSAGLFILGDLFEYWVGRGAEQEAAHQQVITGLAALSAAGVPVHIMGGNRDFLLDPRFAHRCGASYLPDPSVILLGKEPVLLTHGDRLCTDDIQYQRYRRCIQHPLSLALLSHLPYRWRTALAGGLRQRSSKSTQDKASEIMDVNADAVTAALRGQAPYPSQQQPYRLMIHGHTHRPAIHEYVIDGHHCRRIVLGDWYTQGSVLICQGLDCRLAELS